MSTTEPTALTSLAPERCVCFSHGAVCVCPATERRLRDVAYADGPAMPFTSLERDYCLGEIDQVEGYSGAAYAGVSDRTLAAGVLSAWTDFARDKGLL